MKNQIKYKKLISPWDINGYVTISKEDKQKILSFLRSKYGGRRKEIANLLGVQRHWFDNFLKQDKINTKTLKKLIDITKYEINVFQFDDGRGGSSIPFKGEFPIHYTPIWHFIFSLSVGDGHIDKCKNNFRWYQKPEGLKALSRIIRPLGFDYDPSITTCKKGMVIPQLIRKVGSYVTGLHTNEEVSESLISASTKLGREYEITFLMAFFLDEAGMRTRNSSEITLHQEGNLKLLEDIENLLRKLSVSCTRNSKGKLWYLRFNNFGVIRLSELFAELNSFGLSLLHRQEKFNNKVMISKQNRQRIPLRYDSKRVESLLLQNYVGQELTLEHIRNLFFSNFHLSMRSRQLVCKLRKEGKLLDIGVAKYKILGGDFQ